MYDGSGVFLVGLQSAYSRSQGTGGLPESDSFHAPTIYDFGTKTGLRVDASIS